MNPLEDAEIRCPYCGEWIETTVDAGDLGSSYIEDCSVCCRPIRMHVYAAGDGEVAVDASPEDA